MRLIDTSTLQFISNDTGDDVPPYAILSHTWSSREVLFRDFLEPEHHLITAFSKIEASCALARKDGFQYIWVDTCCIDKSSSAELSEAVNSMYTYYKNAEVCYVYLSDVHRNLGENGWNNFTEWAESDIDMVERSRWFTRGWTLQELLAPKRVVFYDRDWVKIGDKHSLADLINQATNIQLEYLWAPWEASVAQKMSWAARRRTTRGEDMAYCLMGLFDVNMPLLYGEGEEKAFLRLQREICRISTDDSLLAWTYDRSLTSGLFAASPANFVYSGDIIYTGGTRSHHLQTIIDLPMRHWPAKRNYPVFQGKIIEIRLNCTKKSNKRVRIKLQVQEPYRTSSVVELAFSDDGRLDSPISPADAATVNAPSSIVSDLSVKQKPAQNIPGGKVIGSEDHNHEEFHGRQKAFEDSAYGTASYGQLSGLKVALPTGFDAAERRTDDSGTEYSDISMTERRCHGYMESLADDLYAVASKIQSDPQRIRTLGETLPDLLQDFALRIGQEVPRKDGREVMFYVYKYRRRIAELFEQNCSDWNEVQEDSASHLSETIPFREKVTEWLSQEDPELALPVDATEPDTGAPEVDGWDDVEKYKEFVPKTSAYTWLLANVAREVAQTSNESYLLKQIRNEISRRLPPTIKVSPRRPPDTTTICFQMDWDPMAFILEQKYSEDPAIVLERVITLTGSPTNAQALPCLQYLIQAWPCSGTHVACLLKELIHAEIGQQVFVRLNDGNKISAWSVPPIVHVQVSGTRGSIIEVGEQIAWLGAALRSSPYDSIAYCRPQIKDGSWTIEQHQRSRSDPEQERMKILRIDFVFDPKVLGTDRQSLGRCWYNLFRNPVVVPGFPILKRNFHQYGLELPLNMIAGLLQVKRAHTFDDVVFIKGYSVMLVPSKQSDGFVVWHVLYNADGSRISYLDNDLPPLQDVGFWSLQKSRHIVGWCSHAKSYAGGLEANYKVERSRLPLPEPGCLLEKVSLNGGKFITAGFQFAIGIKDVPVHISCKPYVQKLRWVSSKFIILWDVAEERGWLVKGISALLHLIRASLKYYETDAFGTALLSRYNDIQEPSTASRDDYPIRILLDERNMKLPIYPEKDEVQLEDNESTMQDPRRAPKTRKRYYRVEDRVEELYETLEKLIDHQINAAGQAGMKMKAHARRRLEGWDFKDLASDKDPVYPHVMTLHALGKGWVDFTRSIQVVTLFGRGFGEIIRPSTAVACHYWSEVPRHKFYLAACVNDLQQIMETDGDPTVNPMRICNGILWYSSNAAFDACRCTKSRDSRHSDFVQTLWPLSLERLLPRRERLFLQKKGAVIFGHNVHFKWKWEDVGNPIEGDPDRELAGAEDEFHDSGIGITDTSVSGPCNQGLSVDGSVEMTSFQQSQTPVSSGPAPGDGPARLANLDHTTAANTSIQVDRAEIGTRQLKQSSLGHRITRVFSMPRFVQRRKEVGKDDR